MKEHRPGNVFFYLFKKVNKCIFFYSLYTMVYNTQKRVLSSAEIIFLLKLIFLCKIFLRKVFCIFFLCFFLLVSTLFWAFASEVSGMRWGEADNNFSLYQQSVLWSQQWRAFPSRGRAFHYKSVRICFQQIILFMCLLCRNLLAL